jgi:hypothetical protein
LAGGFGLATALGAVKALGASTRQTALANKEISTFARTIIGPLFFVGLCKSFHTFSASLENLSP